VKHLKSLGGQGRSSYLHLVGSTEVMPFSDVLWATVPVPRTVTVQIPTLVAQSATRMGHPRISYLPLVFFGRT